MYGLQSCSLLDEQDCEGKTPLHLAVEGGFSPIIEALIEAGADVNIQNNDGKTCLHLVVTLWGSPEHLDKKVQTTNGFEQVVSRNSQYEPLTDNEKLLLYLLDKGAKCTTFDASGDTPIHCTNTQRLWQLIVSR
ncbi:E3 ubiquitin-protein ligase HACE1-like [Strongylocentrotus purpuratus]|uniref:Uncharacterized protein n=1 Tax=Strongylocentrotus purpuratus TaxID=7668 RepID=A0A7M7R9J6_STRPU|nr:E3 ubiquitin-protein ligase HACE1-like [Strongylocentrotus purpuratus]|eukprot:XP_780303.2 PREDICTED: E3 ubiquitin-protein ligase HACE1-like [Strongylocentrotus purpuratus]